MQSLRTNGERQAISETETGRLTLGLAKTGIVISFVSLTDWAYTSDDGTVRCLLFFTCPCHQKWTPVSHSTEPGAQIEQYFGEYGLNQFNHQYCK